MVVVEAGQTPQPANAQEVQSYVCHIIISCITFWFFNPPFGLLAFAFASQYIFRVRASLVHDHFGTYHFGAGFSTNMTCTEVVLYCCVEVVHPMYQSGHVPNWT